MLIKLRSLCKNDIEDAMKLVLSEGWNQTEEDWQFITENPENRCFAAEVDGKLVATAVAMIYSAKLAWIGMVLVNKQWRGKGIAKQLFNEVIKEVNSLEAIKLDATPAGRMVYEKFGFREDFRILRMIRKPGHFEIQHEDKIILQEIHESNLPAILEFDMKTFGIARPQLLRYLNNSSVKGWYIKKENRIAGFLLGRYGNKYIQIGPVAAASPEFAISLISKVLKVLSDKAVVADVLEDKKKLGDWLISVGFETQRPFIRMYRIKNPFPGNPDNQYLIGGPEFG